MNIQKGNKLIAEFMDFRWIEKDANWYVPTDEYSKFGASFKVDELKFHESWDWLMPVIEKINKLNGFKCEITPFIHDDNNIHLWIKSTDPRDYSNDGCEVWWHNPTPWGSVVSFLHWYNKQTCEHAVDVEDNYICPKCKDKE